MLTFLDLFIWRSERARHIAARNKRIDDRSVEYSGSYAKRIKQVRVQIQARKSLKELIEEDV